jgi:hypothetical protein
MTVEATLPADADVRHFDHVMMTYMRERHIPGTSIAVSVGGQYLVRKGTFPLQLSFYLNGRMNPQLNAILCVYYFIRYNPNY